MTFSPGDIMAWLQAIRALLEFLKEIFGEKDGKEVAKGIIRKMAAEDTPTA